ncbi:MAG: hypothetical protein ABI807_02820, partial [Sporichthyaceae bacterium]
MTSRLDAARRRWWRLRGARPAPPAPAVSADPTTHDVPTAAPTRRPVVVLVEVPGAILDLAPLRGWGFNDGPTGLAGEHLLTALACAGAGLDDDPTFDAVMSTALIGAIRAGDLAHSYDQADPDGHYDNTGIEKIYRTDGAVLRGLEALPVHSESPGAVALGVAPRGARAGPVTRTSPGCHTPRVR